MYSQGHNIEGGALRVTIDEVAVHRDARGAVFEPLNADGLSLQRNVHVVLTEPGCVRANHRHRRGTEVLTVFGPALVRYREESATHDREVPAGVALRFTFPPGVAHAVKNTGDCTNLLIAFNTVSHDPHAPDVVADMLIPPEA